MADVKGTPHRKNKTDYFQRCAGCGKIFYFTRNCNGDTIICPHCKHRH